MPVGLLTVVRFGLWRVHTRRTSSDIVQTDLIGKRLQAHGNLDVWQPASRMTCQALKASMKCCGSSNALSMHAIDQPQYPVALYILSQGQRTQ